MPNSYAPQNTISIGLGGAFTAAIGAWLNGNSVRDEALVMLIGGTCTGLISDYIGLWLRNGQHIDTRSSTTEIIQGILLHLAAFATAPLVGEKFLSRGTDWKTTVIDTLKGSSTLAVVAGAGVCFGLFAAYGFFPRNNRRSQQDNHDSDRDLEPKR